MNRLNLKVGLFVLCAIALIIGTTIVLGAGVLLRKTIPAETYIDESVQGLDVGSAVKYRGVQIGTVNRIDFVGNVYDIPPSDPRYIDLGRLVLVQIDLRPETFGGAPLDRVNAGLQQMIDKGLRVRMASQGLTGTAYLEVDYLPPDRFPPIKVSWQPRGYYLPSAPSIISRFSSSAESLIQRLEETDLPGLIDQATRLVVELRATNQQVQALTGGEVIGAIARDAGAAVTALRKLSESGAEDVMAILVDFREAALRISGITGVVSEALNGGELGRALKNTEGLTRDARKAAAELPDMVGLLERTLARIDNLVTSGQRDISVTLENLGVMSENLRELSETAKRYPSQILFGDPPPRTGPERR